MSPPQPTERLEALRLRIGALEARYGRPPGSVKIMAVSKKKEVAEIRGVAQLGQRCFGENYLQEALPKIDALKRLDLEWHYIGRIQSNKTRLIAHHFDWVHTLADERIARRLNDQRSDDRSPLNICIQINISQEQSKAGIALQALAPLADVVTQAERLQLRGLMAMPALSDDFQQQRQGFRPLYQAYASLVAQHPTVDTLSLGSSHDFEAAIAEGTTLVRIGTGIFGPRPT